MKCMAFYMVVLTCLIAGCFPETRGTSRIPLPVIKGEKGFGLLTPAGRGGRIIKVSNLEDAGPGSLRAALEYPRPRIIVFEISGAIKLKSELVISSPFVTISGQTAPPPGITIRDRALRIATHDVLIQHVRIRPGDLPSGIQSEHEERDSIGINDYLKKNRIKNVVIDHCSLTWALDENVGLWGYYDHEISDVTIINSIIGEGLKNTLIDESSYGILVGDFSKRVLIKNNLIVSNAERSPLFKGATSGMVINNLIYNMGENARITFADDRNAGPMLATVEGNVWHDGPLGATSGPVWFNDNVKMGSKVYLKDNLVLKIDDLPFEGADVSKYPAWGNPIASKKPVWLDGINIIPAKSVENHVLMNAGARPGERGGKWGDPVDERLVREVRTHKGSIKRSVEEAGGWPVVPVNRRSLQIPEDPHGDDNGNGYTNIEEMLFRMAAEVEKQQ